MKKITVTIMALILAMVMVFTGCSAAGTQDTSSNEEYYSKTEAAMEPAADMDYAEDIGDDVSAEAPIAEEDSGEGGTSLGLNDAPSILEPSVDRKIIYSGYIESRTKNFEEDYQMILDKLTEAGGYVENAYMYGTPPEDWQDEGRQVEITLRVPSDKFDAFIEMLSGIGENVSSSISGEDISLRYFDLETRLSTLRIREERLQALLEEAKGLEDIIELERELADVAYEIQTNEVEKRNYDSLIDYSTITVRMQEVHDVAAITPSEESVGERIASGFYSVLNALADFGEGLLIVLVAGAPILIILGLIAVLIVWLVKRSRKKRGKKAQTQGEKNNEK